MESIQGAIIISGDFVAVSSKLMWCHPDLSKGLDILKESAQPDLQHLRREAATVAASIFSRSLLAQGLRQMFVNGAEQPQK